MALTLTLTSVIQRNEKSFLANSIGEDTVMMNLNNGDYLGLNNVASDIWNILEEPFSVEDLYNRIVNMYDVEEEQCKKEVAIFLQQLSEHNMLIVHNEAINEPDC